MERNEYDVNQYSIPFHFNTETPTFMFIFWWMSLSPLVIFFLSVDLLSHNQMRISIYYYFLFHIFFSSSFWHSFFASFFFVQNTFILSRLDSLCAQQHNGWKFTRDISTLEMKFDNLIKKDQYVQDSRGRCHSSHYRKRMHFWQHMDPNLSAMCRRSSLDTHYMLCAYKYIYEK